MQDHYSPAIEIPDAPPLDVEKRALGVSASEIAAVLGLSQYEDAFTVYQRKVGAFDKQEPAIDVGPMRWGRAAESELLLAYCEVTGRRVFRPGTLSHPDRPWQIATPDGLVRLEDRGVECKTADSRLAYLWGDPDLPEEKDKIPSEYYLQCQYSMSVTDRPAWDVPVLIGGNDFRIYSLAFDKELEEMMLEAAHDFVFNHLVPRVPPPIGWSPASSEFLKRKFPQNFQPLQPADESTANLAVRLYGLQTLADRMEQAIEQTKNDLKLAIGDAEGITDPSFKITWKKNKDSVRTNWKTVAEELRGALQLIASASTDGNMIDLIHDALSAEERNTQATPGARPFRTYFHFKSARRAEIALAAARKEITS